MVLGMEHVQARPFVDIEITQDRMLHGGQLARLHKAQVFLQHRMEGLGVAGPWARTHARSPRRFDILGNPEQPTTKQNAQHMLGEPIYDNFILLTQPHGIPKTLNEVSNHFGRSQRAPRGSRERFHALNAPDNFNHIVMIECAHR